MKGCVKIERYLKRVGGGEGQGSWGSADIQLPKYPSGK